MNLFAIAALSCGISCVILSFIAHFFGKTRLHRLIRAFNIAVAAWGFGSFIAGIAKIESTAILGWQLAHLGGFFVAPAFYHLASEFCGNKNKTLLYFGYLQAIIFSALGLSTNLVFYNTRYVYDIYYHNATPLYLLAVIFYIGFVTLGYYKLLKYLSISQGTKRKQTKHIIYGFLYGFLGGTSTFLPMFHLDIIYPLGNFGVTTYCLVLTYSILRHRLMDFHIALKKSIIYTVSVALLTSIFIVLVLALTKNLSDFAGVTPFSITVISALITAILFTPLKNIIQSGIDKIFYMSHYNHYSIVQKISHELTSTIELSRIYELVVDTLFDTLKLKNSYLLFRGEESLETVYLRSVKDKASGGNNGSASPSVKLNIKNIFDQSQSLQEESQLVSLLKKGGILIREDLQTNEDNEEISIIEEEFMRCKSEVAIPIIIDYKLTFILMLGEKLSGFIFSQEDVNMLKTIANQASMALKNAKLYDELEQRLEQISLVKQDWENTFNSIDDMITIHDKNYNIIQANKASVEILNSPLLDRNKINNYSEHHHGINQSSDGYQSFDCDNTTASATFEVFEPQLNKHVEVRSIPRLNKKKQHEGLIHIVRDISKRKHDEELIKTQINRLNALRSMDQAILASLDLNLTLDIFLSNIMSELGIDAVAVMMLNKETQVLECLASKGFRTNALQYTRLRLGESNAGRAALERRIVTIPNLKEYLNGFVKSELFPEEDFISYFAIPLVVKGETKGVLELFHRSFLDPDPGWFQFLEAIAAQGAIAIDSSAMFDNLQLSNMELKLAYDTTIEGWARALDMRDNETEGHSRRVTDLSTRIAVQFKMNDEQILHIRRGALLHDIGKMGIPDSILLKPGKLTDEEWKIMKLHPIYARDLLYPIEHLRPAIDIPYCHHERWDGKGYPEGLKGENIPLSARIFAVVDVWDALRSDRPYRPAWSKEKVKDHIKAQTGTHFDAGVVEVFLSMDL